jgi:hypothetical protein
MAYKRIKRRILVAIYLISVSGVMAVGVWFWIFRSFTHERPDLDESPTIIGVIGVIVSLSAFICAGVWIGKRAGILLGLWTHEEARANVPAGQRYASSWLEEASHRDYVPLALFSATVTLLAVAAIVFWIIL